jgi:protein-disulfide isomerase
VEPEPAPVEAPTGAPARAPLSERRAWIVLVAGVAALVAGLVLILVDRTTAGGVTTVTVSARPAVPGADETAALLAGIPQSGFALGDPKAPVTLVEWADLQCPYCRQWSAEAFPKLVRDYVRPGKLLILFRGLAFLGPDSTRALQFAVAAGVQDRLWQVVDLLYRNQGVENSGWATDSLLHEVAASVDGLDTQQVFAQWTSAGVLDVISQAAQAGTRAKVTGTPTFDLGKTGAAQFRRLNLSSLDAAAFEPAIEQLLR